MIDLILILIFIFILSWIFKTREENGYVFARFPFSHENAGGSLPNPKDIKRGYRWTNVFTLTRKFKKNDKNIVYFDNFRFDDEYVKKSKIPKYMRKKCENKEFYFNPIDLRQSILLVGKMGSGKTEMYYSVLSQKWYNRAVIHQIKAGDFASVFLRKRDILFSPYDKRGYLWNVMDESEGVLKTFFENYANAIMGNKKDFFSAAANRLYNELAQKNKILHGDEKINKKWLYFIKAIKDLFIEMDSASQNSQKDVKGTMQAMIEPLEIMAFKMQDSKQKTFTIKEFFAMKNQTKLILDNLPEYEKSLTPLFSAFTACLSQVHASLPNTTTDFSLYALDEYLSFVKIMDESAKKTLHTAIRSKGGIMMPAVQYIPQKDKELQQLLTSSNYMLIYFSVIDNETIELFKKTIGDVEFTYKDENITYNNKGDKSKSYSVKSGKDSVIYNELLNGLGEKYEHIMYLPNTKTLYKGYTPQVSLRKIAKEHIPNDLTEFYKIKYATQIENSEDLKNLTFADLFKEKEKTLSKLDEYKLFKKFEIAKTENNLMNFKKDNQLIEVNLEFLFKKFIADKQVIDNKMKLLSIDERFKLKREWDALTDEASQLEFIEKNELFGALPTIFEFDNLESLEDIW